MAFWLPALFAAGSAIAGGVGKRKQRETMTEADLMNRYRYQVLGEQAFDPYGPYRRAKRGALWASFARAWGFDKILGEDFLEHLSDPKSVPGTEAIGGAQYPTGPPSYLPQAKPSGGGWGLFGDILGGAGMGMGGFYPSGSKYKGLPVGSGD
jgi:hypothetical protein